MNERDLWWKIVLVGAAAAVAVACAMPLREKLRFGIDLDGGYSLLYEIDDTGLNPAERADLAENVMRVLRERVDPKGVYNLVWRPVGSNRLEIQMPRPSPEVVEARRKYESLQERIQQTVLRRTDVLRALAKKGDDRAAAFDRLIRDIETRRDLLGRAAEAYDALEAARVEYDERVQAIQANNLTRDEIIAALQKPEGERGAAFDALVRGIPRRRQLLDEVAIAWSSLQTASAATQPADGSAPPDGAVTTYESKRSAFEQALGNVLAANVDPDKSSEGMTIDKVIALEETLDAAVANVLETNPDIGRIETILEAAAGDPVREEQLKALRDKFSGLIETIDGLVAANDQLKVRRRGEGRLEDPADLQRLLKGAGVLEFRILAQKDAGNPAKYDKYHEALESRGPRRMPGEEEFQWFEIEDPKDFLRAENLDRDFDRIKANSSLVLDRFGNKYYVLAHIGDQYAMTHRFGEADWSLKGARFDRDEIGRPAIGFTLDERGGEKFANLTRINRDKQLCIFLDDLAISHATINTVIRTNGIIKGSFSVQEVQDMVKKLNAGSLPRKLKDPPISVRAIGPSLGEANRTAGLRSTQWAGAAVVVFMIVYYFYAGGVAVVAVGMNLLLTLAIMSVMGATLTLPGIAGLVLALGMAVDANVLINERMREELARGNTMRMAIKLGYERAFRAILDSNVTTLLTCVILYWVGSEEIKGFGLTLGIGVVLNLFTAYFVTRLFFEMMALISIPKEVIRYPVFTALGVGAFGALLFGAGCWRYPEPIDREASVLVNFGEALMEVAPAIIGLLLVMTLGRLIHRAFQQDKARMPMMQLIPVPGINWIGKRAVFLFLSAVLTIGGLAMFLNLDSDELYDIEFLGGTAAQIDVKSDVELNQSQVKQRLVESGEQLRRYADALGAATVSGAGGTYTLSAPGVPAARLEPIIKDVMESDENGEPLLNEIDGIRYEDPGAETVTIRTRTEKNVSQEQMEAYVDQFAQRFARAAEAITNAQVQVVESLGDRAEVSGSFEIVTLEPNKEVVVGAIMATLQDDLNIQPALTFNLLSDESAGGVPYFALREDDVSRLNLPISKQEAAQIDLRGWKGGVAIILDNIRPPQRLPVLRERLRSMRLQPGFESHGWRPFEVFGLKAAAPGSDRYSRVTVIVADENYPLIDEQGGISPTWASELAEPEVSLIQAALQRQTSLSQITQFDNQVSAEAQTSAYIAVALSWLIIILYVWFRFGNIRWGLAAVAALVHDVIIALGAISATHYLIGTPIARWLLLDNFRIDLALVAALLTVIGYSVNDTIIVFDRIRENRGRLTGVTPDMVNLSINQTLSRTILTGLTTLLTILTMYVFGGPGIHGFCFAMFVGILTGTYSSFAIAAQFLVRRAAYAAIQKA